MALNYRRMSSCDYVLSRLFGAARSSIHQALRADNTEAPAQFGGHTFHGGHMLRGAYMLRGGRTGKVHNYA